MPFTIVTQVTVDSMGLPLTPFPYFGIFAYSFHKSYQSDEVQ